MRRFAFALAAVLLASPLQAQTPAPASGAGQAFYEFLMARRLEAAGDDAGALAALERAKKADPNSPEILAEVAGYYARQNKADEAVAAAEQSLKLDPANVEAHHIMGLVYSAWAEGSATPPVGRTPEQLRA